MLVGCQLHAWLLPMQPSCHQQHAASFGQRGQTRPAAGSIPAAAVAAVGNGWQHCCALMKCRWVQDRVVSVGFWGRGRSLPISCVHTFYRFGGVRAASCPPGQPIQHSIVSTWGASVELLQADNCQPLPLFLQSSELYVTVTHSYSPHTGW